MKSIYPVIVLYKIGLEDAASYKTLLKPNRIENFLVYDNSPEEYKQDISAYPTGAVYVRDTANSGLSKAYNMAAQKARALGYSRILLLDQDTKFSSDAWNKFLSQADYKGITAPMIKTCQGRCFSPVDIRGWGPKVLKNIYPKEYSLQEYAVVNSGCCIPIDLFEKAGGYSEKVKLDFSDFQFQIFARKYEPQFLVLDTLALQDFSNDCKDSTKLLVRFGFYLDGARNFRTEGGMLRIKHHYAVLRHTISLFIRTRNFQFLLKYFQIILLNK